MDITLELTRLHRTHYQLLLKAGTENLLQTLQSVMPAAEESDTARPLLAPHLYPGYQHHQHCSAGHHVWQS